MSKVSKAQPKRNKRSQSEKRPLENNTAAYQRLLEVVTHAQTRFVEAACPHDLFSALLSGLLSLTDSEYGFIGEVHTDPKGKPYLKSPAFSDFSSNPEAKILYEKYAAAGLELHNLDNLFGKVITTGQPVISNNPSIDPRRGGIPKGHPFLKSFLGLPFYFGKKLMGMLGIANRPGGYDQEMVEFLQPFLITCANLLEGYRNQEQRKRAEAQSRKLSRAVEQNPCSIIITALDGMIEYVNPKFTQVSGYSPEEALGKTPALLKSGCHDDEFYRRLWKTISSGKEWRGEMCNRNKRGELYWVSSSISPVTDSNGVITHYVAVNEDITEKKKIEHEKKLLEAHFQRTQRMESIGRLAGGIAHNFNNILSGVLGYASLIKCQMDPGHQFHDDINMIEQSAQQAGLLVKKLLEFAQAKGPKMEAVELSQIVKSAYSLLEGALKDDIVLEHIDQSGGWSFMGDGNQVQQALLDLCLNARDAMPEGGKLTVILKTERFGQPHPIRGDKVAPGKYVVLEVSDTGKGMTEEIMEHIFEPFFTTKEIWEGTGLGLSTVYGMVKDHRGYIDVQSQPDIGSTFTLYFPGIEPAE